MRRSWIIAALVLTALGGALALVLSRRAAPATVRWEQILPQRGELVALQHEVGELQPVESIPITMPLKGRIEWLVADGVAVEAGERLVIINEDEALSAVIDLRGELMAAEQELALARLRRDQAVVEEDRKVAAAERELELTGIEYRIRAGTPLGEQRLLELHEQLLPLEAAIEAARETWEEAFDAWRAADAAFSDADDAWQEELDADLRRQARLDELAVRLDTEQRLDEAQRAGLERERDTLGTERSAGRARLPALVAARQDAAAARDAAAEPLHRAAAVLDRAEDAAREPAILMEIEKRGVEAARLAIDVEVAELDLAEAREELAAGEAARAAGSLSDARLDEHRAKVAEAENALDILRERLAIAARPPPEEELTEARLARERAEVAAQKARQVRDRAIEKHEVQIRLEQAQVAKLGHRLDELAAGFPAVIEHSIGHLDNQLDLVADANRRAELEAELARAREQLQAARAAPPNIVTAPAAGLVRLGDKDNRPLQVGDELDLRELVLELRPPQGMQVVCAVNELDVARLAPGMPAIAEVLALGGRRYQGRIVALAGAGRDKFSGYESWSDRLRAGVTVFDCRIALEDPDEDLRQGLTVLVAIERERLADVLHLPRRAVSIDADGGLWVTVDRQGTRRRITGRPVGDDAVLIESGLTEGEPVYLRQEVGP